MDDLIIWDTESTDLYATWGRLLCFTWMTLKTKRPQILRISDYPRFKNDPTDDRDLVRDIKKVLDKAGAWFTWFGTKHDVPLVNSRLIYHDQQPLANVAHIDGWRVAKDRLRLPRNSLATVSGFLGVAEKTPIKNEIWVRARAGHIPSLRYVYQHGLQDALVTKQVYERMLPLIDKHPNIYRVTDPRQQCNKCGTRGHMISQGLRYAEKKAYRRIRCTKCGGCQMGGAI